MKYVYILQCESDSTRYYTGLTDDLRTRVKAHNAGQVFHTSKFRPWRLNTYIGFSDVERAVRFEKYLKSHSGRAFARNHL